MTKVGVRDFHTTITGYEVGGSSSSGYEHVLISIIGSSTELPCYLAEVKCVSDEAEHLVKWKNISQKLAMLSHPAKVSSFLCVYVLLLIFTVHSGQKTNLKQPSTHSVISLDHQKLYWLQHPTATAQGLNDGGNPPWYKHPATALGQGIHTPSPIRSTKKRSSGVLSERRKKRHEWRASTHPQHHTTRHRPGNSPPQKTTVKEREKR